MGKGQFVDSVYQGITSGFPHPMMTISVGIGRARSDAGMTDEAKVLRYSWQFYKNLVHAPRLSSEATYTAQEMSYEDNQYSSCRPIT